MENCKTSNLATNCHIGKHNLEMYKVRETSKIRIKTPIAFF